MMPQCVLEEPASPSSTGSLALGWYERLHLHFSLLILPSHYQCAASTQDTSACLCVGLRWLLETRRIDCLEPESRARKKWPGRKH